MTSPHLLDANALIALGVVDHEHHDRAAAWASTAAQLALCPIVEGAFVRFLVRMGESAATAAAFLEAMYATSRCVFWEDSLSYTEADVDRIVGHRQVTDAYVVALAVHRGCRLATFDRTLAGAHPDDVDLIP